MKDVTTLLRNTVKNNVLDIDVSNETLGGDPAYGVGKRLTVLYSLGEDGAQHTATQEEGKHLHLGVEITL